MKQIFILELHELADLKRGEPLTILLGTQEITLQAEGKRRALNDPVGNARRRFYSTPPQRRKGRNSKGETINEKVFAFLKTNGPTSAVMIARGINELRSSTTSALQRMRKISVKRTGHLRTGVWRLK